MDKELEENAKLQREYFDKLAPTWRSDGGLDMTELRSMLSPVPLRSGERVLDIACGAGVLDECLLSMGLRVDGIDISEKMIEKARADSKNRGANYFAADFYSFRAQPYDCLLAFDCYPHFADKKLFAERAYSLLKENGLLFIFFDQSRESINGRHEGHARSVSIPLFAAADEAKNFAGLFDLIYSADGERYSLLFKKKGE